MPFSVVQYASLCCLVLVLSIKMAVAMPLTADTVAPDYSQAVDYCLWRQYPEAEVALLAILRQASHPNRNAAIHLLTEEVYLSRSRYRQYVALADSINYKAGNYAFAQLMSNQPPTRIALSDSVTLPFHLKKRGHIVVSLFVNGTFRRFMIDTGAQRTTITNRLADELRLLRQIDYTLTNSLGQTLPSSIRILDSLRLGTLYVDQLPVMTQSLWGFGVDGVLGWDVLRHLELVIDYPARTLRLRPPAVQPGKAKTLLGGSRPMIVVQNGSASYLTLFLDTGSNENVTLTPLGQAKLTDGRPGHELTLKLGFGGRMRLHRQKAVKGATIQIADNHRRLRKMSVERLNEWIGGVLIDGTVGSGFFRTGRLVLDPINSRYEYQSH